MFGKKKKQKIVQPEYYCTHCGAVLNEQAGFSPDVVTWTCACCGTELCGDDVLYEGERYPGVLWYCDECNDLLNNQEGFTDRTDTWKCLKCGFDNKISAGEIFETNEAYIDFKRKAEQTYKCPNCGSITHGPKCEFCGITLDEFRI